MRKGFEFPVSSNTADPGGMTLLWDGTDGSYEGEKTWESGEEEKNGNRAAQAYGFGG